jgi:hypothetical protein
MDLLQRSPDIGKHTLWCVVYLTVSVGVKVVLNVCCVPILNTVRDGGVQIKVPGTDAVTFVISNIMQLYAKYLIIIDLWVLREYLNGSWKSNIYKNFL